MLSNALVVPWRVSVPGRVSAVCLANFEDVRLNAAVLQTEPSTGAAEAGDTSRRAQAYRSAAIARTRIS
jgi:hypothetical protein